MEIGLPHGDIGGIIIRILLSGGLGFWYNEPPSTLMSYPCSCVFHTVNSNHLSNISFSSFHNLTLISSLGPYFFNCLRAWSCSSYIMPLLCTTSNPGWSQHLHSTSTSTRCAGSRIIPEASVVPTRNDGLGLYLPVLHTTNSVDCTFLGVIIMLCSLVSSLLTILAFLDELDQW